MLRSFLNIADGRNIPDHRGVALADPEQARLQAMSADDEMLPNVASQF